MPTDDADTAESHPNRTHDDPDRPELTMHQSPKAASTSLPSFAVSVTPR